MRLTNLLAAGVAAFAVAGSAGAATLTHAYDFNGSTVTDSVGGANGSLNGGATVSGGVLHLDGVDDYVGFSTYLIPSNPASFSVYLDVQGTPAAGHTEIISQSYTGAGFYIGTNPSGFFRLSDAFLSTPVLYPSGAAFHKLLLTVGGGVTNFYIDGANVFTGNAQVAAIAAGDYTQLGRQFGGNNEYFNGQINTLKIFDGIATQADISGAPEPAGWALMILGFGSAGAMLRRRKTAWA